MPANGWLFSGFNSVQMSPFPYLLQWSLHQLQSTAFLNLVVHGFWVKSNPSCAGTYVGMWSLGKTLDWPVGYLPQVSMPIWLFQSLFEESFCPGILNIWDCPGITRRQRHRGLFVVQMLNILLPYNAGFMKGVLKKGQYSGNDLFIRLCKVQKNVANVENKPYGYALTGQSSLFQLKHSTWTNFSQVTD